jgi:hypothetical protein
MLQQSLPRWRLDVRRCGAVQLAAMALLGGGIGTASAQFPGKQIPQPPGLPRPPQLPQPWNRDDNGRGREWQEQQQRDARERNERDQRWQRERQDRWDDRRGDGRWDRGWDRRWDGRPDPWAMRPAPPVYVVPTGPPPRRWAYPRPRYGAVVPVLPWAATVLVVGGATYWYCDGVYYRRLAADAGYDVVDGPSEVGDGRIVDVRLFVYPRNGQGAQQQASDEYDCHRWAVDQTGFDPTTEGAWNTQSLEQRDDYRRAQTACLDGRGYTVK